MTKKCSFCAARAVVKRGSRDGVTRYFCVACRRWSSSVRRSAVRARALWHEYVREKRTKEQLGNESGKTIRTVTKILDAAEIPEKVFDASIIEMVILTD